MSLSKEELKLVKETKKLTVMRTKDECIAFEENVYKLAQNKSREMLQMLLGLFDDNCPCYEAMYSLVHAVETYPVDMYISVLTENSLKIFYKSTQWLLILLYGIANHSLYKQNFCRCLISSFHEKEVFFEKLRKTNPQYVTEINELENRCLC